MGDFIGDIINAIIYAVGEVIGLLLALFPDSPFLDMNSAVPEEVNLSYIAWVIPFPTMIVHFLLFLEALLVYYIVRIAARWIKMVRS